MVTQLKPEIDSEAQSGSKGHMVEKLMSPLMAVYSLLAGPPMSERERERLASIDASIRMSMSVNPYDRTRQC